ncbi:MAG: hypothetical protein MN733_25995 [Nitrososphaera sp.]|nr:hypothetical protein [Nitrososphaera sp.]
MSTLKDPSDVSTRVTPSYARNVTRKFTGYLVATDLTEGLQPDARNLLR